MNEPSERIKALFRNAKRERYEVTRYCRRCKTETTFIESGETVRFGQRDEPLIVCEECRK